MTHPPSNWSENAKDTLGQIFDRYDSFGLFADWHCDEDAVYDTLDDDDYPHTMEGDDEQY